MAKIARVCDAEDCDRPVLARGLCSMHYQRARYGDETVTLRPVRQPTNAGRECSIDGCSKPARNRTWCEMHYSRWREHGDPLHEKRPTPSECRKCGAVKFRSERGRLYCKPCANATDKAWREANTEAIRVKKHQRYERDKDRINARAKAYYEANRAAMTETNAKWRAEHPEQVREYARRWAARNPKRCLANVEKRRARQLSAICKHGASCVPWNAYLQVAGQMCVYCGAAAEHLDHYIPLSRGGLHCRKNLVPACATCNRRKGSRMPDEWTEYLRKRGAA